MPESHAGLDRLRHFIATATRLASPTALAQTPALEAAFADLVRHDDWLPEACTAPHPQYYQQYLLHCDPLERFSLDPDQTLYALHRADGARLAVLADRESAFAAALAHELAPVSVH